MAPSFFSGVARVRITSCWGTDFGFVDDFGEGEAGDGAGGGVEEWVEFAEKRGQTAGVVEVLHVMRAGGFEVEENGDFAGELIEIGEGEGDAGAVGDGGEMNEAVGGTADGLQDDGGVADRGGGEEVAGLWCAGGCEFGGASSGGFGDAAAVGGDGGCGGGHGEREAEGFDEAGHGAGGAHGTAGADGGAKAAGDEFGFGNVDFAGAVLAPRSGGNRCRRRGFRRGNDRQAWGRWGGRWRGDRRWRAAMTCAGRFLSQPPMTTTESMGCARIISSVSMARRLRRNMEVGWAKDSAMEMVGKTMGSAPASRTPRLTDSMRSGTLPWQGLKSLAVLVMPTMGRSRASSE